MIELQGLSKRYGQYTALRKVNLNIENGEFVAVLGPSGCGKTTLLKLLAGFLEPTSGFIEINQRAVAVPSYVMPPEKRSIGMVFQSFALWPHLTVADHVRFPLIHHSQTPRDLKKSKEKRVQEVLLLVGLEEFHDRYPADLSGGQKQRVAFARAIAHKPDLLLMDEPLSALDAELRIEMRKEIQKLHRETGATIVYVTHDQNEALAMADRVVVMRSGQIEQAAQPHIIYNRPETEFVATFVGKSNIIKGNWSKDGEIFQPEAAPEKSWPGRYIALEFKQKGIYPVRPEQWLIKRSAGIKATVELVQYQGRDIHYIVSCGTERWTVHQPAFEKRLGRGDAIELAIQ